MIEMLSKIQVYIFENIWVLQVIKLNLKWDQYNLSLLNKILQCFIKFYNIFFLVVFFCGILKKCRISNDKSISGVEIYIFEN